MGFEPSKIKRWKLLTAGLGLYAFCFLGTWLASPGPWRIAGQLIWGFVLLKTAYSLFQEIRNSPKRS